MKLEKLSIEKFKGAARQFQFTGRDLILGRSGSGKTAIVQAIGFGHHGFDPLHLISRRQLADTFQDYAPGTDEVAVSLEFSDPPFSFSRSIATRPGRNGKPTFSESIKIVGSDANVTESSGKILATLGSSVAAYTLGSFLAKSGDEQMREAMEILVASGSMSDPRSFVICSAMESHLGEEACRMMRQFVDNPGPQHFRDAIVKRGETHWMAGFDLACQKLSTNANPILCINDSLRDLKDLATDYRAQERSAKGAVQELMGQKEAVLGTVAGGRETLESSRAELLKQRSEADRAIQQATMVIDQADKTRQQIADIDLKIAPIDPAPLPRKPEDVQVEIVEQEKVVRAATDAAAAVSQALITKKDDLSKIVNEASARRGAAESDARRAAEAIQKASTALADTGILLEQFGGKQKSPSEIAAELESMKERFETRREEVQTELTSLNGQMREADVSAASLGAAMSSDRHAVEEIELAIERFASGKCPECLSIIDVSTNERIVTLKASISELNDRISSRQEKIAELQEKSAAWKANAENVGIDLRDLATEIKAKTAQLAVAELNAADAARYAAESAVAAAKAKIEDAERKIAAIHDEYNRSPERKTFDESTANLQALHDERAALAVRNEQLVRLADLTQNRKKLLESIPQSLPDMTPLETKFKEVETAIAGVDQRLRKFDEMKGVDKQIEIARDKMTKAEKVLDAIECLVEGLRKLRKQVLEEPLGRMQESVTRVYSAVFPGWSAFFRVVESTKPALEFGVTDGKSVRRYAGLSTGELLVLLAGVQLEFVSRCPWRLICLEQASDHLDEDLLTRLLNVVNDIGSGCQIICTGHEHAIREVPPGWNVVRL